MRRGDFTRSRAAAKRPPPPASGNAAFHLTDDERYPGTGTRAFYLDSGVLRNDDSLFSRQHSDEIADVFRVLEMPDALQQLIAA
ncbi:MAG: hypothetical protein K0R53_2270 [Burkholderiales bacterium]|nr:hypothetical protein [Burkholderiales bacterium]